MTKKNLNTKIAVVGLGYVGLPLALLIVEKNYQVIGIDINEIKVKKINRKIVPFKDSSLSKKLKKSRIKATTDFEKLVNCSTIIVCVPSPVNKNHKPDLKPIRSAFSQIGKYLQKDQLIILESTVNPGVCEEIIAPLLKKISGLSVSEDFYLAHCPERINPGDKVWTVENIPRVVGGIDTVSLKKAVSFYKSIIEAEIYPMDNIKETEAVKIVENAFRDINIAFVNELAQSFYRLRIDVLNVIKGASTKPFSFLAHYPSCGVGGHSIPADPYYLIDYARKNVYKHRFLTLARKINDDMPRFTVKILETLLIQSGQILSGSNITVLGLAYKGDISSTRESPSLQIIDELEKAGAIVSTYDPFVKNKSTANNIQEAVKNSNGVIVATAHTKFKNLTPEFFSKYNVPIVVDGQNILSKEEFSKSNILYQGIGTYNK
jgi:nucleotide sugar dehydrogenase